MTDWPPVPILLRELRGDRTQEQHAAELGVAREQYNRWARGKSGISQANAERLAKLTPYPVEAWNRPAPDLFEVMVALSEVSHELTTILEVVEANRTALAEQPGVLASEPFLRRLAEQPPDAVPAELLLEAAEEHRLMAAGHLRTAEVLERRAARSGGAAADGDG